MSTTYKQSSKYTSESQVRRQVKGYLGSKQLVGCKTASTYERQDLDLY